MVLERRISALGKEELRGAMALMLAQEIPVSGEGKSVSASKVAIGHATSKAGDRMALRPAPGKRRWMRSRVETGVLSIRSFSWIHLPLLPSIAQTGAEVKIWRPVAPTQSQRSATKSKGNLNQPRRHGDGFHIILVSELRANGPRENVKRA